MPGVKPVFPEDIPQEEPKQEESFQVGGEVAQEIELMLPGNLRVTMGQPDISTTFLISRILGPDSVNAMSTIYLKALMYVKSLNGEKVNRPTSMGEAQALANKLSDPGMDIIVTALAKYWPPITIDQLPVVKKSH